MKGSTIFMMILACVLFAIAFFKGDNLHFEGSKAGLKLLAELAPLLFFAFIVAGLIQVLLPLDLISKWLGAGSGLKGILVGTAGGALIPGGPMLHFPILASFYKSGAGVGPITAYLTAWSVLSINRMIVYDIPFLGVRVTVSRVVASLVLPVVVGIVAKGVFTLIS